MSKRYQCILIDDELLALSYLRALCEELPNIEVIKAFDKPEQLLQESSHLIFDFYISDIVMPGMNGLELASRLKGKPVIFTTAHNEFAADAFDIDAVDYLRKPVQKQRLEKAIEKVIQFIETKGKKYTALMVNTDKGKMLFQPADIVCISSETIDRRDKLVLLLSGERRVIKNTSFDELLAQLPEQLFCRISKSEVIAMRLVTGYSGDTIHTSLDDSSGKKRSFILSESYRRAFMDRLS